VRNVWRTAALVLAFALTLCAAFAWVEGRQLRGARIAVASRDYRLEEEHDFIISKERLLRKGQAVDVLGQFTGGHGDGVIFTMDASEVMSRVRVFFGFDPREILAKHCLFSSFAGDCHLDSRMNLVSLDTGPYYQPGDWVGSEFPLHVGLPRISRQNLKLDRPIPLLGPAKILFAEDEAFGYNGPYLWSLGFLSDQYASRCLPEAIHMRVVLPDGATSGWLCAISDLHPEGNGFAGRLVWSTYGGYVYIK
jgi:hypothetical protein